MGYAPFVGQAPLTIETSVVAQSEPEVPRFERVAVLIGLGFFLLVLGIGFALYLVEFQVDGTLVKTVIYGTAAALFIAFLRSRPSSKLTPTERMIREKRRVSALIGLLGATSVLGSIVVAYQLHTWQDWVRLGLTASSPIGFFFLIRTRFSIG